MVFIIQSFKKGCQWRSQNAEKFTHIKGRLLDQAVIVFKCVTFHNGNFSERKEFAPSCLREVPYAWKLTFTTLGDLP